MAFSNISDLQLGKLLQIHFSEGMRLQLSRDYRDYEQVKMLKASSAGPREIRFLFQNSLGTAAIQYRNPGVSGAAFAAAQQITQSENTALLKELSATIELEYNLWKRAKETPEKYAEPLAKEMESKLLAMKRQLGKDLYGDGTGVIGQLPASSATVSGANVVFSLETSASARGHVGWFEYGDILVLKSAAGGASALDTDLATEPAYWKVVSRSRKLNSVTLQPLNSSLAAVTVSSITTQPTAGEVFYRYGQPSFPNLGSISDYGSASEVIAGLGSLVADDGRNIHGITMSGSAAASIVDCGGSPFDVSFVQEVMDFVKVQVGQGAYKWPKLCAAPEAIAAVIESRETDRRFQSIDDAKRGIKRFGYVHGDDLIEFYSSEYVPFKKAYILPETKGSDKVLEFHGLDFEPVKANDMSVFHLKPAASGGHAATMVSYMMGSGVLINKHPAACAALTNFTV